jgi:hypothetical protein
LIDLVHFSSSCYSVRIDPPHHHWLTLYYFLLLLLLPLLKLKGRLDKKKKEITQNLFVFDDDSAQVDEIQNKKRANEVCIDH